MRLVLRRTSISVLAALFLAAPAGAGTIIYTDIARDGMLTGLNLDATAEIARAVSIDDESLRTMQAIGLVGEVLKNVVTGYGVHYLTEPGGRCFAKVEPMLRCVPNIARVAEIFARALVDANNPTKVAVLGPEPLKVPADLDTVAGPSRPIEAAA